MGRGGVEGYFGKRESRKSNTRSINKWNLDSTIFYPQLEDKLRKNNDSYNSKNNETNLPASGQDGGISTKTY